MNSGPVVVTGAGGFIGGAVARALVADGVPVVGVDRIPVDAPGVYAVVGDLRDASTREGAVPSGAAAVLHLAAATSVLGTVSDPFGTFEHNVEVTAALLDLVRRRGVPTFVHASTNAVVGGVDGATIDERTPVAPLTPYGSTKASAEVLVGGYARCYGLAASNLRFTNVYGPGMGRKESVVARLMRAACQDTGLEVYGDGLQRRDFVHVTDVVAAVVLAWRRAWAETVVVGAGRSVSVLDLVDLVRRITGRDIPVTHAPARPGEMRAVEVNAGRAKHLGFAPSVHLEAGLTDLWPEVRRSWAQAS